MIQPLEQRGWENAVEQSVIQHIWFGGLNGTSQYTTLCKPLGKMANAVVSNRFLFKVIILTSATSLTCHGHAPGHASEPPTMRDGGQSTALTPHGELLCSVITTVV